MDKFNKGDVIEYVRWKGQEREVFVRGAVYLSASGRPMLGGFYLSEDDGTLHPAVSDLNIVSRAMPECPPVGTHVMSANGLVFVVVRPGRLYIVGDVTDEPTRTWESVVRYRGPLTLITLTEVTFSV